MLTLKRSSEPLIHLLIWISFYTVFIVFVNTIGPFKRADGSLFLPVTSGTIINLVLFYGTSLVLIPRFSQNKKVPEFILLLLLLMSALTFIETITDKALFRYYYSDNEESFAAQFILNFVLNFIVASLALGYGFTRNWLLKEKMQQMLMQEKLTAELDLLRSQLNPHFLFNVLNMAFSSASRSGDERTAGIIEKLSGLLRYTTYESNVEKVNLEKEVEYLRNYIDLQKMRLPEDMPVIVRFNVKGDTGHCRITPLILIQFVENTFKHGIKLGRNSEIDIRIAVDGQKLEFETINPLQEVNQPKTRKGIGIENVKKRLSILYPDRHHLIMEEVGNSFKVKLIMDLD